MVPKGKTIEEKEKILESLKAIVDLRFDGVLLENGHNLLLRLRRHLNLREFHVECHIERAALVIVRQRRHSFVLLSETGTRIRYLQTSNCY